MMMIIIIIIVIIIIVIGAGKVLPYSLPSVGPGADPAVQAVKPAVSCHYFLPGLLFDLVSVHQMAPPKIEVANI